MSQHLLHASSGFISLILLVALFSFTCRFYCRFCDYLEIAGDYDQCDRPEHGDDIQGADDRMQGDE